MRIKRYRGGGGFEAFRLPPVVPTDPVSPYQDFQINQRGALPRRELLEAVPPVPPGPPVTPAGFDRHRVAGMLDQPSNQIGRSIILGAGGAAAINGASAPLIQARCSDERARQLTLFLTVDTSVAFTVDRDIVGLLSWGVGGMMISNVEIDFVNGAQLSVIASFVQLNVRSDAAAAQTQFSVGAFLGYESGGRGAADRGPQRTLKTGALLVAATTSLTIPRYASSFSIVRTPLTTGLTIEFLDGPGNVMGVIPVAAGTDVSDRVFPIPGDAMTLRLTAAAVDLVDARVVFGLAL